MHNILISGGAGFIGSHLVRALSDKGYRVTVLDNLSPQVHGDDPSLSPLLASIAGKAVKRLRTADLVAQGRNTI